MSESKTKPTEVSVDEYLSGIADQRKVADSRVLIEMMSEITGEPEKMWGPSMIGFGRWRYRSEAGSSGAWFWVGFAPRSSALTLYITSGLDSVEQELSKLGKYKAGKGCLYIKRLSDIDLDVLRKIIEISVALTRARAAAQLST